MSKRNRIVERASDVNGGQYIQTNPSYNSGYEDGKKAGKEYCASEIESLSEQLEKLQADADRLDFLDRNLKFNTGWDVGIAPVGLISVAAIGLRKTTIREAIDNARNGK